MSEIAIVGLCVLCLFAGTFFGILIICLCTIAGEADDVEREGR